MKPCILLGDTSSCVNGRRNTLRYDELAEGEVISHPSIPESLTSRVCADSRTRTGTSAQPYCSCLGLRTLESVYRLRLVWWYFLNRQGIPQGAHPQAPRVRWCAAVLHNGDLKITDPVRFSLVVPPMCRTNQRCKCGLTLADLLRNHSDQLASTDPCALQLVQALFLQAFVYLLFPTGAALLLLLLLPQYPVVSSRRTSIEQSTLCLEPVRSMMVLLNCIVPVPAAYR